MANEKICITFSSGGHFTEASKATILLNEFNRFYVTFKTEHLKEFMKSNKVYFITHPKHGFIIKRLFLLFLNAFQATFILLKERPTHIVSTGADVTVPLSVIGRLLGAKLIYVESGGQVYTPSLTGRLVYKFANLFLVQWEPQMKKFPDATYGGPLL